MIYTLNNMRSLYFYIYAHMVTVFKIFEANYDVEVDSNIEQRYIDKLIDDLTVDIYKRANNLKRLKVKSIKAKKSMNKTVIVATMSNDDTIGGIFNDRDKSITVNINDKMVFDVDYPKFNIDKLIIKMSDEYKKYLKEQRYKFIRK